VPQGAYVSAVAAGGIVMSAGMTPRRDGRLLLCGRVGSEVTVEEAQVAAGIAAANAVRALADAAGGLDRITQCLRVSVYVACTADFPEHSRVADGASMAVVGLLGERGRAARSAIGVVALPSGAPVEVELTALVADSGLIR
jgi:enamine deaminase RidA (YjgF/YER057c/UK114 family)